MRGRVSAAPSATISAAITPSKSGMLLFLGFSGAFGSALGVSLGFSGSGALGGAAGLAAGFSISLAGFLRICPAVNTSSSM